MCDVDRNGDDVRSIDIRTISVDVTDEDRSAGDRFYKGRSTEVHLTTITTEIHLINSHKTTEMQSIQTSSARCLPRRVL
jgi:hypothetical protein